MISIFSTRMDVRTATVKLVDTYCLYFPKFSELKLEESGILITNIHELMPLYGMNISDRCSTSEKSSSSGSDRNHTCIQFAEDYRLMFSSFMCTWYLRCSKKKWQMGVFFEILCQKWKLFWCLMQVCFKKVCEFIFEFADEISTFLVKAEWFV